MQSVALLLVLVWPSCWLNVSKQLKYHFWFNKGIWFNFTGWNPNAVVTTGSTLTWSSVHGYCTKLYCTDIVWPLLSLLSPSSSTAIDVKAEISAKWLCYQFLITPAPLAHGVMFNRYSKTNWHSKAVQHCVRVRQRASAAAIVHWLCESGHTEGPPKPPWEDMHALWVRSLLPHRSENHVWSFFWSS